MIRNMIISLTVICACQAAQAYETAVHAYMTKAAFDRSVLSVNNQEVSARTAGKSTNETQAVRVAFRPCATRQPTSLQSLCFEEAGAAHHALRLEFQSSRRPHFRPRLSHV
jgi:hypothetical protein